MKKFTLILISVMINAFICKAEEQVNLTSPIVADPSVTSLFKLQEVDFNLNPSNPKITITLSANSVTRVFTYSGTQATNLMTALNTANLSIISLRARIFNQLINDGSISGTVTGTP